MTMRKPPGIHENPLLCYSSRLELQKRSTFLKFILLKRKDPIPTFAHFADNGTDNWKFVNCCRSRKRRLLYCGGISQAQILLPKRQLNEYS